MYATLRTFALAAASLAFVGGCSAGGPSAVRVSPTGNGQAFAQTFSPGIADVRDAGDTDLVAECVTPSADASAPAVRQVIHVRVLWQQGYKPKAWTNEVSQNAALHWYVYPVGSAGQAVEYTGVGTVSLDRDGDRVHATIVDARISPTSVGSRMADPIGASKLTGTIHATLDRRQTVAALTDLAATSAAARANRPTPAVEEARLPTGG